MARKGQASIQDTVDNNEDFDSYLQAHFEQLILMEVYSEFCGPCLATGNAVRKGKLEIGGERVAMVKACADGIDALVRFRDKSEPCFLFILRGRLVHVLFGANGILLCRRLEAEMALLAAPPDEPRVTYDVTEMLPEEKEKAEFYQKLEQEHAEAVSRLRELTLAARKQRVCRRLAVQVPRLNFILFWPHCHQAHYDLYEKWDVVNIQVAGKETVQLSEQQAREALYASDVQLNEACLHALLAGECLVVLFKMFETDYRDFVKVLRHALYEEIMVSKEDEPPERRAPPVPAYERYATVSKTAREVRRDRYEAKLELIRKEKEECDRLAAEQARLLREAEEERAAALKKKQEEERFARLQAGLPPEPEPEEVEEELKEGETTEGAGEGVDGAGEGPEGAGEGPEGAGEGPEGTGKGPEGAGEVPVVAGEGAGEAAAELAAGDAEPEVGDEEAKVEEEQEEVFHSDVSVEGEDYIPPGGLFVPGLYCPPNQLAKANGIALFYPKVVEAICPIESEYLPPHVLVMFSVDKRHDVKAIIDQYKDEMLNYGIFVGDDPHNAEHVAYTVKQYDKMIRLKKHLDRMAIMVSRKRSLPLLQLAGLNPCYISNDVTTAERECLSLFPVGYGDDYEEEETLVEEEVAEVVNEAETEVVTEAPVEEPKEEEDEDD